MAGQAHTTDAFAAAIHGRPSPLMAVTPSPEDPPEDSITTTAVPKSVEDKPKIKLNLRPVLYASEFFWRLVSVSVTASFLLNVCGYGWDITPDAGFQVDTIEHLREERMFRLAAIHMTDHVKWLQE